MSFRPKVRTVAADALEAQRSVEASAKVLKRTDEVLSALLDTAPHPSQSR